MADAMYSLCTYASIHSYMQIEGKREVDQITWERVGQRIRSHYDRLIHR